INGPTRVPELVGEGVGSVPRKGAITIGPIPLMVDTGPGAIPAAARLVGRKSINGELVVVVGVRFKNFGGYGPVEHIDRICGEAEDSVELVGTVEIGTHRRQLLPHYSTYVFGVELLVVVGSFFLYGYQYGKMPRL